MTTLQPTRRGIAYLLTIGVLLVLTANAYGQAEPSSRISRVLFTPNGLGVSDQTIESISLDASFDETIMDDVTYIQPGGAANAGSWNVSQSSSIADYIITASLSQNATVSTDFGSPGILTDNIFDYAFTVPATINAVLTGAIASSGIDFARVQFMIGNLNTFNTSFGHTFPYSVTLEPGFVYHLALQVDGGVSINASSTSSASAVLTLDQPLLDSDGDGATDDIDNCTIQSNPEQFYSDGDGFGNLCDTDLTGNCITNFQDLALLASVFLSQDADADFNGDGTVNFLDFSIFSTFFLMEPGPSAVAACP